MIFIVGCSDDLRNRSIFDSGAGNAVIRFSVENVSLTRNGESEDFESIVDHAYLLFYDENVSIESATPLAAVRAEVNADMPGKLQFKMPLQLEPNTDYQLLAIANADDYVPSGFNNFRDYLESWCKAEESDHQPIQLFSGNPIYSDLSRPFPMNGGVPETSSFRFTVNNGIYSVPTSLSFRRLVARIDVANIIKDGFKVESVALCNWRDAVPVAPTATLLGNRFGIVRAALSMGSEAMSDLEFVEMPDSDETGVQQLNKRLYCFPSVSYDSFAGDNESTALIIKAKYGDDSESTYYRVNVGMSGNHAEVKANTKYLVTIQSVKGSGASTPEEAYSASESKIMLSVVEDWDIEGNAFDMDENGNFIVLSKGSLEFAGDDSNNTEVKVLTSKGLSWTAEYIADNEESASAFNIVRLSDSSLSIGPSGTNENDHSFSGICKVSATTAQGGTLAVNISLRQNVAEEKPYEPVIPEDMPFAIIPESYERVKINHEEGNRWIEIDGFDPDCFNSFIDVPFKVYINDSETDISSLKITTTLEWPLEGRISQDKSAGYLYGKDSFGAKGTGSVYSFNGTALVYSGLYEKYLTVEKDKSFFISVGAMGPDDPAIVRELILEVNGIKITYTLILKPRQAIIDDVILKDAENNYWLIQDRNIQNLNGNNNNYIGRDSHGQKYQAYNYSKTLLKFGTEYLSISIPFKFKDQKESIFREDMHDLYLGKFYTLDKYQDLSSLRLTWLKKYCYSENMTKTSPFYDANVINNWVFPSKNVLNLCCSKLRVSKMRMYLVSDIWVKEKLNQIPICCYLPYHWINYGGISHDEIYGYYTSEDNITPDSIILVYFENNERKSFLTSGKSYYALSRLVRPLTFDELEDYKVNYLGYGTKPHKLSICHPDTYESTKYGWIPY